MNCVSFAGLENYNALTWIAYLIRTPPFNSIDACEKWIFVLFKSDDKMTFSS